MAVMLVMIAKPYMVSSLIRLALVGHAAGDGVVPMAECTAEVSLRPCWICAVLLNALASQICRGPAEVEIEVQHMLA